MRTAIGPLSHTSSTPQSSVRTTVTRCPELLVVVQRDWNGWRKGMVPVASLQGIHWRQPHGAPRPLIHAYVTCDSLLSGDVPHECADGALPHRLLVCVLKSHTAATVFQHLVDQANAALPGQV